MSSVLSNGCACEKCGVRPCENGSWKGTQEYESCQLSDMDVDMDESNEELSSLSSAAGWHEPQFMCDRQCQEQGFQNYDIASVMVADDGER